MDMRTNIINYLNQFEMFARPTMRDSQTKNAHQMSSASSQIALEIHSQRGIILIQIQYGLPNISLRTLGPYLISHGLTMLGQGTNMINL